MTATGALKLSARCGDVPAKSTVARRAAPVDGHADDDLAAVVQLLAEAPGGVCGAGEPVEHAAHRLRGVVLNVAHVGRDHGETEVGHHALQFGASARVGGDLGTQIGQVLRHVARRVRGRREQLRQLGLAQPAALDEPKVFDQHAFFVDAPAARRHRSRRDAADVGVVGA